MILLDLKLRLILLRVSARVDILLRHRQLLLLFLKMHRRVKIEHGLQSRSWALVHFLDQFAGIVVSLEAVHLQRFVKSQVTLNSHSA